MAMSRDLQGRTGLPRAPISNRWRFRTQVCALPGVAQPGQQGAAACLGCGEGSWMLGFLKAFLWSNRESPEYPANGNPTADFNLMEDTVRGLERHEEITSCVKICKHVEGLFQ